MRRYLSRDQLRRVSCEPVPFLEQTLNGLIDAAHQNGWNISRSSFQDQANQVLRPGIRSHRPADWTMCQSLDSVPTFGLVEVYGGAFDRQTQQVILKVQRPGNNPRMFAATEEYNLIAGLYGWVRLVNPYAPVRLTCYGGTPNFFDELVPQGTSVVAGNGGQMVCVGTADADNHVAVLSTTGTLILKGQTTATHAKGTTQTVNVFRRGLFPKGLETFTPGDTVQAYNTFATLAGGKWCAVANVDGGWELIAGEC